MISTICNKLRKKEFSIEMYCLGCDRMSKLFNTNPKFGIWDIFTCFYCKAVTKSGVDYIGFEKNCFLHLGDAVNVVGNYSYDLSGNIDEFKSCSIEKIVDKYTDQKVPGSITLEFDINWNMLPLLKKMIKDAQILL